MTSTDALNLGQHSQSLGHGEGVRCFDVRKNKKKQIISVQSLCIDSGQGTVMSRTSHLLQAMWILSAFSTPHAVEACRWLAARKNLFLHLPFPSWHRSDRVYSSVSHRGLALCWFVVDVHLGLRGIKLLIVWLCTRPSSEWNLYRWDKEPGILQH